MFRRPCFVLLAPLQSRRVSAFGLFMKQWNLDHPFSAGDSIAARGKALGAAWKALTVEQQQSYKDRAKEVSVPVEEDKRAKKVSAFGLFLKDIQSSAMLQGKPFCTRGKLIGEAWKTLSAEKRQQYEIKANPAKAAEYQTQQAPKGDDGQVKKSKPKNKKRK